MNNVDIYVTALYLFVSWVQNSFISFVLIFLFLFTEALNPGTIFPQLITRVEICIIFGRVSGIFDYITTITPQHQSSIGFLNEGNIYKHCFTGLLAATVYRVEVTPESAGQGGQQQSWSMDFRTGRKE